MSKPNWQIGTTVLLCLYICHPYLTVQLLHGDQVQGLERVARGRDEVEAGVDARVVVAVKGALDLQLLLQVALKLTINVVHHRLVTARDQQDVIRLDITRAVTMCVSKPKSRYTEPRSCMAV